VLNITYDKSTIQQIDQRAM